MRAKLTAFFLKLGEEKSSLVPVLRREEVTLMQRVMFGVSQINYTRKFFFFNPSFPGTFGLNLHLMVFTLSFRGQN